MHHFCRINRITRNRIGQKTTMTSLIKKLQSSLLSTRHENFAQVFFLCNVACFGANTPQLCWLFISKCWVRGHIAVERTTKFGIFVIVIQKHFDLKNLSRLLKKFSKTRKSFLNFRGCLFYGWTLKASVFSTSMSIICSLENGTHEKR